MAPGITASLAQSISRLNTWATTRNGTDTQYRLSPLLRIAVISLFRDRIVSVSSVDIRMANGMIWKRMLGNLRTKYQRIWRSSA